MNPPVLDGHLHHQLIPHREQSAILGISSSSSVRVHAQPPFLADKFPPQLIDPTALWHHHHPSLPPLQQDNQLAISLPYQSFPMFSYETHEECAQPSAREKRHCCQLCNKRFDRPSTLKKHMLVHTGEKAWACAICGRRFSVSSNLNRHARRCKEKWSKSDSSATDASPSSALSDPSESAESPPSSSSPSSSSDGSDAYGPSSPPQLTDQLKRRQSAPALVQYETDDGSSSHDHRLIAGLSSRKRRKGSPNEPWVPASLVHFNLDPTARFMPTPLPAVVPGTCEERNSYADTPLQAYHPSCWAGHLVGPSYAPKSDEMARGRYCGKLLVF